MTLTKILAAIILMAAAALAQPSVASRYDFMTLDYPGSLDFPGSNYPLGLNNKRQVVGFYTDNMGTEHGYLWQKGKFTTIDVPGVPLVPYGGSGAFAINDRGDIAGLFIDKNGFEHGYLRSVPAWCDEDEQDNKACKPVFTTIDVPGAAQTTNVNFEFGTGLGTAVVGLNNDGVMAGLYATPGLYSNAFSVHHGVFRPYAHPAASHLMANGTKFFGIGNSGVIAGAYQTQANLQAPQITHAFLLDGDDVTPIDAPGSEAGGFGTQATAVNASREAIGVFTDPTGAFHGFYWKAGHLFRLDYPGMLFNEVHSINDRGDVTGGYATDAAGTHTHGYIAFPKDR